MPNSCSNVLSIAGPPDQLERFQAAAECGEGLVSFESLFPLLDDGWSAEEKHRWIWQNRLVCPPRLRTSSTGTHDRLVYEFVTAWSPSIELIERIALEYQELTFELRYCEPAMAKCGHVTVHGDSFEGASNPACSHAIDELSCFGLPTYPQLRSIMAPKL